jgi:hypothetical protein
VAAPGGSITFWMMAAHRERGSAVRRRQRAAGVWWRVVPASTRVGQEVTSRVTSMLTDPFRLDGRVALGRVSWAWRGDRHSAWAAGADACPLSREPASEVAARFASTSRRAETMSATSPIAA